MYSTDAAQGAHSHRLDDEAAAGTEMVGTDGPHRPPQMWEWAPIQNIHLQRD